MTACAVCGGPGRPLGALGSRHYQRCENCGIEWSVKPVRHYHVLAGFNGLYMPDSNDVCYTKREAQACLHELAEDARDRIACDKMDAAPGDHIDRITGSYRDGCYIVERSSTQIDYCYQIEECYEPDCLEDAEDWLEGG